MSNKHEVVEKHVGWFFIFTILAISIGGLVEITPLFFQKETTEPVKNLRAYTALEMEGRDIYIREGCNNCHSQMIRPFRAETERYGHYSVAGESVWEHPFLDPRAVVPESNMPGFPWLEENILDGELIARKMEIFNSLTKNRGHKDADGNFIVLYSPEDIATAKDAVKGKTEMQALIAYLQSLGHALK
jgi:cytochrome c oxidase cbb3-type subunit 2